MQRGHLCKDPEVGSFCLLLFDSKQGINRGFSDGSVVRTHLPMQEMQV